jgi:hypothetical protein
MATNKLTKKPTGDVSRAKLRRLKEQEELKARRQQKTQDKIKQQEKIEKVKTQKERDQKLRTKKQEEQPARASYAKYKRLIAEAKKQNRPLYDEEAYPTFEMYYASYKLDERISQQMSELGAGDFAYRTANDNYLYNDYVKDRVISLLADHGVIVSPDEFDQNNAEYFALLRTFYPTDLEYDLAISS